MRASWFVLMTLVACAPEAEGGDKKGDDPPPEDNGFAGLDTNDDGELTSADVEPGRVAVYLARPDDDGGEIDEGYDVEGVGVISGGLACNDEFCRENPFVWSIEFQLPGDVPWRCELRVHQTELAANPPPEEGESGLAIVMEFWPVCTVVETQRFGLPNLESADFSLTIDAVDSGRRVSGTYNGAMAIHEGEGSAEEFVVTDLPVAFVLKGVVFRAIAF